MDGEALEAWRRKDFQFIHSQVGLQAAKTMQSLSGTLSHLSEALCLSDQHGAAYDSSLPSSPPLLPLQDQGLASALFAIVCDKHNRTLMDQGISSAHRILTDFDGAVAQLSHASRFVHNPEYMGDDWGIHWLSGRTNNPWNLERTPGGSSGGESAAIAAGMSPIGLGTDLAISVRGPAAQTGIVSMKATHGRVPMTGIWPRKPRRFWHIGPMARSIRDLKLAYSILAGPDGSDSLSTVAASSPLMSNMPDDDKIKIGWLVSPGVGPIAPEIRATVEAAAKALRSAGYAIEAVRIPELEQVPPLDIFLKLHINEMKPVFEATTAGRHDNEIGPIARSMLGTPLTSADEFIKAEQAADRLKDGFAKYFAQYDALLCPVLPMPAHVHNLTSTEVEGEQVDGIKVMAATVPFNVTGLPALSMPFGFSRGGLPINVQLVGSWYQEAVVLGIASKLEMLNPKRYEHPEI
ncbi:hypothetical protein LTR56_026697 [Elasticomyces elasticus]|nr:hypothetical protein LTR56_026697 [Elasticomyces elasticus]KAK3617071.1 hypothetical protein LTR22_026852 [Elasticomyces elasticus]KAK5733630.1 hypothetical protein LTS12_026896 [Elasticomyces elasticus]